MHRREYKRTTEAAALDDASQVLTDCADAATFLIAQVERLDSSRVEVRIAALKSIIFAITAKWLGTDVNGFINDLTAFIQKCLLNPGNNEEHNLALLLLCNLSLSAFTDFEACGTTALNTIFPTLSETQDSDHLKFFAAAFVVSFSVSSQDLCVRTLENYAGFITNKKSRAVKFSPRVISSITTGLALMVSMFPEEACVAYFAPLDAAATALFNSKKIEVLSSALDLVSSIYSTLSGANNGDQELRRMANRFGYSYIEKIRNIPSSLSKAEALEIKKKCKQTIELLSGESVEEEVALNSQIIHVDGFRKIFIMQMIRRVTQQQFQPTMTNNKKIHEVLGFDLMKLSYALYLKKKFKKEIKSTRADNAREREESIAKKRRQREFESVEE